MSALGFSALHQPPPACGCPAPDQLQPQPNPIWKLQRGAPHLAPYGHFHTSRTPLTPYPATHTPACAPLRRQQRHLPPAAVASHRLTLTEKSFLQNRGTGFFLPCTLIKLLQKEGECRRNLPTRPPGR